MVYDTPRSLTSFTASSLNSRVNFRLSMTHLLLHKTPNLVSSEPGAAHRVKREESEKFKRFSLETLLARDKVNLDIFWVKDHALDDPDLLPPPDEVAAEIVESLETALERFRNVAKALGGAES